jgi:hypothetical protein
VNVPHFGCDAVPERFTAACAIALHDTPSECLTLSGKEAFMRYGDAEWKALRIADRPPFYQLAKGDLVEPDIHGNDMGRDPRKIARDVLAQYHPPMPVLKAIRAKCIDCSGGSADEARKCTVLGCALWPFRMGTNPHRDTSNYAGASLAKVRKIKASSFKSVPPATWVPDAAT